MKSIKMASPIVTTEQRLPESSQLDLMSTSQILSLINREDGKVAQTVADCLPQIERAVNRITAAMCEGGRLIYVGCGTSGRLAVTDASECPVTFGVDAGRVCGVIAGDQRALVESMAQVEDDPQMAVRDMQRLQLQPTDVVVGVSASGSTSYVLAACQYAKHLGCTTIGICCNHGTPLAAAVQHCIEAVVGAEVLTGSTRMKAGDCYDGWMVSLRAAGCAKLQRRATRIVQQITGCSAERAQAQLAECDFEVNTAVVSVVYNCDLLAAKEKLDKSGGKLRRALQPTLN